MRFTDPSGAMLDIYQAASQMTDESGQSYPYTIDTLLDNALGSKQYFGAFTINAHTDVDEITESTTTVASAKARNIPIITAKQLLDWTDARNASTFKNMSWAGNKLTFTVACRRAQPHDAGACPGRWQAINKVTRGSRDVSYAMRTVKGVNYAFVTADGGDLRGHLRAGHHRPDRVGDHPCRRRDGRRPWAPRSPPRSMSRWIRRRSSTSTIELRTRPPTRWFPRR